MKKNRRRKINLSQLQLFSSESLKMNKMNEETEEENEFISTAAIQGSPQLLQAKTIQLWQQTILRKISPKTNVT